jgi:hypothetical protein
LKKDPAVTAGTALIAEVAWQNPELPAAGAKTATGTEAALNAATFSENKNTLQDPTYHSISDLMAITEKIIFLTHTQKPSSSHASVADQRASKRFKHEIPLIIKNCDCGTYASGRMYNYSHGGIYFESNVAFKSGTCVRIDIENSQNGPAAGHYYATVTRCDEISDAVVLYDYGIGIKFDRGMNRNAGIGKLRIIQGAVGQNEN